MTLSTKDIQTFARCAIEDAARPLYAATDERKAMLLAEARVYARAYYAQAQDDVKNSGFRVTQRVKDILWATLESIANTEMAKE